MSLKQKCLNRILLILLTAVMFSLAGLNITAFAGEGNDTGEQPNIQGSSFTEGWGGWNENYGYGVRVTLVDAVSGRKVSGTYPIDYTHATEIGGIKVEDFYSLGGYCKTDYILGGESLFIDKGYYANTPPTAKDDSGNAIKFKINSWQTSVLPRMLNSDTTATSSKAEDRKTYFTNREFISAFAADIGKSYEEVISGKYKIMYEPVVYAHYPNYGYCLAGTLTEFAIFEQTSQNFDFTGHFANYFTKRWTAQWLCYYWATSVGLETSEFGLYNSYDSVTKDYKNVSLNGGASKADGFTAATIEKHLGVATVTFTPSAPQTIPVYYYIYNENNTLEKTITTSVEKPSSSNNIFRLDTLPDGIDSSYKIVAAVSVNSTNSTHNSAYSSYPANFFESLYSTYVLDKEGNPGGIVSQNILKFPIKYGIIKA